MAIETVPDNTMPSEGLHIAGGQSFDEFGATLPNNAQSFLDDASTASTPSVTTNDEGAFLANEPSEPAPETPRRKILAMSKKMKKSMDKLRGKCAKLPISWFHSMAKGNPEWELDEEEQNLIQDSIDTLFEVLDIQVAIEPLNVTLTSIWWVVAYPVCAFGFLFLSKQAMVQARKATEQEQQDV